MAKKQVVKFKLRDGVAPNALGHLGMVALRAPLDMDIRESQGNMTLDFGVLCDHPLLVLDSGKFEVVGKPIVLPNEPVKVIVKPKIPGVYGRGEQVMLAVPLGLVDFDVASDR